MHYAPVRHSSYWSATCGPLDRARLVAGVADRRRLRRPRAPVRRSGISVPVFSIAKENASMPEMRPPFLPARPAETDAEQLRRPGRSVIIRQLRRARLLVAHHPSRCRSQRQRPSRPAINPAGSGRGRPCAWPRRRLLSGLESEAARSRDVGRRSRAASTRWWTSATPACAVVSGPRRPTRSTADCARPGAAAFRRHPTQTLLGKAEIVLGDGTKRRPSRSNAALVCGLRPRLPDDAQANPLGLRQRTRLAPLRRKCGNAENPRNQREQAG